MEIWECMPGEQALTPDIHFIPMKLLHILRLHSRIAQVSKATNLCLQVTKKTYFFPCNQQVSIGTFLNKEYTTIVFCEQTRTKKRTKTYNKELY